MPKEVVAFLVWQQHPQNDVTVLHCNGFLDNITCPTVTAMICLLRNSVCVPNPSDFLDGNIVGVVFGS